MCYQLVLAVTPSSSVAPRTERNQKRDEDRRAAVTPQPQLRRRRKTRWRMKTTWGGPTVLPLSLSLSLSRSLSVSLCLSLSQSRGAPAAALPAAGDLRRGCGERAKASSQWAQPEKCLRGRRMTSLRVALTLAGKRCVPLLRENAPRGLGRAQYRSFGGRAPRRGGTLSNV